MIKIIHNPVRLVIDRNRSIHSYHLACTPIASTTARSHEEKTNKQRTQMPIIRRPMVNNIIATPLSPINLYPSSTIPPPRRATPLTMRPPPRVDPSILPHPSIHVRFPRSDHRRPPRAHRLLAYRFLDERSRVEVRESYRFEARPREESVVRV